jgi:methyltransferase (TIGR00027 family)
VLFQAYIGENSMKANRPSRTAEHNALFRAIESVRTPQTRVVNDQMASHFLSIPFHLIALLARNPACRALLCRYIDYRWPGSRTSVIARTRLIDHYVTSALASGVSQVVLLGAGFDTRAYRLAGAERVRFFEVDHPNTLAVKKANVRRSIGTLPEHVKYIAMNFQHDSARQALGAVGFDPLGRSLFLWEGVSNYLSEESVRATLSFISGIAEGTQLVFTYVDEAVLRNPATFAGGREIQQTIAKIEEPWTFGIRPDSAAEFLRGCGLSLDSDLSASEYRKPYYHPGALIRGYEFYHVATAHVPGKAEHLCVEQPAEVNHA